jgi:hypothetical protein
VTEDEAKTGDGRSWAATACAGIGTAQGEIAMALASRSTPVLRSRLKVARDQLREAEENLTRALLTIENCS